jgi:beta-glucosidase
MKFRLTALALTATAITAALAQPLPSMPADLPPYRHADLPVEQRIVDLLGRMTFEEKIDQLHQSGIGDTNPNNLAQRGDKFHPTYGSFIIGGPPTVLATRNAFQKRAVTESRLGIPAIFGADVIHGYRAITPIPLAQACSWNPELVQRGCAMVAEEARAHGVDWTFAPMVDHCVDARWGRIAETFGESPYAASVFSVASVRGFQGGPSGGPGSIAACLKHYVGYGASEGGRDYVYTEISRETLWDMHLPPFEAGVHAGARTVMSAFNDLSGIPTSANAYTLTEILRHRWGFTGPVVSDWAAVAQLINQGFAADGAEAAAKALNAGVDIDMADGLYRKHAAALVESGRVSPAVIDEAVRRVLRLKFELGLFEHPYTEASALSGAAPNPAQLAIAEELAARSIVLLKNNGVLPLAATARHISLIGPLATDRQSLLGCWAQQGQSAETQSIAEALKERLPAGATLRVEPGCSIQGKPADDLAPAVAAARESDLVILCVGEDAGMSGENASRSTLRLAGRQEELVQAVAATGRPVVLVLVSGRPLELNAFEDKMAAVVAAWEGGSRAAAALADILLGRRNPSGRLAVTWSRTTGQIPLYHNMRPRARTGHEGVYRDIPTTPQYEFAHGLSYTTFGYSPLRLDRTEMTEGGRLTAEVSVTNTGAREGVETVFWFIRDPAASITRPLKELKHFEQASLAPGASRVFRFEIDPARDLSFPDGDGRRILEPGEIILTAGGQSASFHVQP